MTLAGLGAGFKPVGASPHSRSTLPSLRFFFLAFLAMLGRVHAAMEAQLCHVDVAPRELVQ